MQTAMRRVANAAAVSISHVRCVASLKGSCAVAVAMRPRTRRVVTCASQARFYEPAPSFPSAIGKPEVDAVKAMVQSNCSDEVILTILQALMAKAVAPVKDELMLLNMEVGKLNTEVGKLNTEVGKLNTEVVHLQGELNTEVACLQGELNTEVARLQRELNTEVVRLRELNTEVVRLRELNTEVVRLQWELYLTTAQYLNTLGLLHMRGLMEYIQDTMHMRTNVQWDETKAKDCWRVYLDERKSLQECLKKNNVSPTDAPDAMMEMYGTLTAVHDSRSPDEYQQTNTRLYIGPPLKDSRQCAMMACLCKDVNVAYAYRV